MEGPMPRGGTMGHSPGAGARCQDSSVCDTRCSQLTHTGQWCPFSRGKVIQDPIDVLGAPCDCSLSDAVSCYLMRACGRRDAHARFALSPPSTGTGRTWAIVCSCSPGAVSVCTETISTVYRLIFRLGNFHQGSVLWAAVRELSLPHSESQSWAVTEFQKWWFWGKVCLKVMTLSPLESPLCAEILLKKEHWFLAYT